MFPSGLEPEYLARMQYGLVDDRKRKKYCSKDLHPKQADELLSFTAEIFYIHIGCSISTCISQTFLCHADHRRRRWTTLVSHRALLRLGGWVINLHPLAFGERLPQSRQKGPLLIGVIGSTK